jgi:hypothetical protein
MPDQNGAKPWCSLRQIIAMPLFGANLALYQCKETGLTFLVRARFGASGCMVHVWRSG